MRQDYGIITFVSHEKRAQLLKLKYKCFKTLSVILLSNTENDAADKNIRKHNSITPLLQDKKKKQQLKAKLVDYLIQPK